VIQSVSTPDRYIIGLPDGNVGLSNVISETTNEKQTNHNNNNNRIGNKINPSLQILNTVTIWSIIRKKEGMIIVTEDDDLDLLQEENNVHDVHLETEKIDESDTPKKHSNPSTSSKLALSFSSQGSLTTQKLETSPKQISSSCYWTIEFRTGELVFISSPISDKRIRCDIPGNVSISSQWKGWEVWRFIETGDEDGSVFIVSFCHDRKYLCSDDKGRVFTKEKQTPKKNNVAATSVTPTKEFMKDSSIHPQPDTFPNKWKTIGNKVSIWGKTQSQRMQKTILESKSNFSQNVQRTLDPLYDVPKLTDITMEEQIQMSKWIIHKAPKTEMKSNESDDDPKGVCIQSLKTGKLLRINGKSIYTSNEGNLNFALWDFQSAHRQTYYLTTIGDVKSLQSNNQKYNDIDNSQHESTTQIAPIHPGRRIGINKQRELYLSNHKNPMKQSSEEWTILSYNETPLHQSDTRESSLVYLFNQNKTMYLGSTQTGQIFCTGSSALESTLWNISENTTSCDSSSCGGGYILLSHVHKRILSIHPNGEICTIQVPPSISSELSPRITWNLLPKLPRQINAAKMKTLAIASTAAIATTVAAPFVLSGAVGLLGIAEVGLAAEIVAGVGLAAEAMASVAIVGSTARSLMHSANVGTKEEEGDEETEKKKVNHHRPFCAWTIW